MITEPDGLSLLFFFKKSNATIKMGKEEDTCVIEQNIDCNLPFKENYNDQVN